MAKEKLLPIAAAVASVLVLGGILVANQYMKPVKLDANGCLPEITGKTVILIDQSEAISQQTTAEIIARATKLIDTVVKEGELVSVFSITELSKKNLTPVFAHCKPPKNAKGVNESERIVNKTYQKTFAKPLEAVLRTPITGSTQSPIAQAVIDVSLSDYLRHPTQSRLVLFSDFMENTERFSLYNCRKGQDAIGRFRVSRGVAVARPTFNNVEVQAHFMPRAELAKSSASCTNEFWNWFFGDNGGKNAAYIPESLPG